MQIVTGIRMFVLATQHGSLAAAGRHLGVSTASVSRQIAAVEAQLKVRLFNRGTRALTLTEAGEMLLHRTRPLLDGLDQAIDSVSLLEAAPRGLLRVNVRAMAASRHLVPVLPRFLNANPEVHIDLFVSNEEDADLIADNIDVDIRYTRPDSSDLVARLLAPSQLVLVAAPAYLEAYGTPIAPDDLHNHQAILYRPLSASERWEFAGEGTSVRITPQGRLRVNDGTILRSALLAGVGIGMMPLQEVDRELASGALIRLLPGFAIKRPQVGSDGLFAVYQKSAYQTGKLRSFLSFISDVFAEH